MDKYYGYGELELRYQWNNGMLLSGLVRPGLALERGFVQIDYSFPWHQLPPFKRAYSALHLWFQARHGHGESLFGYRERATALAIGFGFRP